jgi:hypothetical protein
MGYENICGERIADIIANKDKAYLDKLKVILSNLEKEGMVSNVNVLNDKFNFSFEYKEQKYYLMARGNSYAPSEMDLKITGLKLLSGTPPTDGNIILAYACAIPAITKKRFKKTNIGQLITLMDKFDFEYFFAL